MYDEAREICSIVLEQFLKNKELLALKKRCYSRHSLHSRGNRFRQKDSERLVQLHQSGNVHEVYREASDWLRKAEDNPTLFDLAGSAASAIGEYETATVFFSRSVEKDPLVAQNYCNLGLALIHIDEADRAIESFQKAVKIDPKNSEYHSNLAAALLNRGNLDASEFSYLAALDLEPANSEALQNLAKIKNRKNDQEGVAACYKKLLASSPDSRDA